MSTAVVAQDSPTNGQQRARIEASLLEKAKGGQPLTFWVVMRQQADLQTAAVGRDWVGQGTFVHDQLRTVAGSSQKRLKSMLSARGAAYKPFWILNTVQVTAAPSALAEIAGLPEVKEIIDNRVVSIPTPMAAASFPNTNGVEWNLGRINAPIVWSNYLAHGEGVVVCNIDTGVQYDHPALVRQYRGNTGGTFDHNYNWFDAGATPQPFPYDEGGHGTHTMGTMVGDDGAGTTIGVAPGAKWIAAKACSGQNCDFAGLFACAQWVLAPTDLAGSNAMPSLRPNIVNNSWGIDFSDPWFQAVVQQWVAAGIFPVFSGGNSGQLGCFSVGSPADYPESYAVGAFDYDDNLSWFSSLGPAISGATKPNIVAPGSDIRSSVPGSGYSSASGTSMAAPHLAGAIALLWSAAPSLKGDIEATRALLDRCAVDVPGESCGGSPTNNSTFGEGRLDISIVVAQAPVGTAGSLSGTVSNGVSGAVLEGAEVLIRGSVTTSALTDASGVYSFPAIPTGSYSVEISAYGFLTLTNSGVAVDGVTPSVLNAGLVPASTTYTVSGYVLDIAAQPIVGATIYLANATNITTYSDANGAYTLAGLPEGTHTIVAEPTCCYGASTNTSVVLTSNLSNLNFIFPVRTDMYGYRCTVVTPAYTEATYDLGLTGDDFYTTTNLPFTFTFYGQQYDSVTIFCDGYVQFASPSPQYVNQSLPTVQPPNAAIYAFWDELWVPSTNTVRVATNGVAPNRRFIIEWRDVFIHGTTLPIDFEVILEENGRILCQYRDLPNEPIYRGGTATLGIENQDGTLALQYALNTPAIEDSNFAIEYWLEPAAYVRGQILDGNDNQPVPLAKVTITENGNTREITAGLDGTYLTQLPLGEVLLRASANNYVAATTNLTLAVANATNTQDFTLTTPRADLGTSSVDALIGQGRLKTYAITFTNTGGTNLHWKFGQLGGAQVSSAGERVLNPLADPDARDARGRFLDAQTLGWPIANGEVLDSWEPTGMTWAWGVARPGDLYFSDAGVITDYTLTNIARFTANGAFVGSWKTSTNGVWAADLAYDSTHNLLCQVNVGGTGDTRNCITCWDPSTGAVVTNLTGAWTNLSQRGLAYRPDNDTFYVGGWNSQLIYSIKGLSWDAPGGVLSQIQPVATSIAGLAWNPVHQVIWMVSNEVLDRIYALDPASGAILATLAHPNPGYNGAGLECDAAGRLWTVSQNPSQVYLLDTRINNFTNVPWISLSETNGVLVPGQVQTVMATIDSSALSLGTYAATLFLDTDSGRNTQLTVPVSASVFEEYSFVTGVTPGTPLNTYNGWVGMKLQTGVLPLTVYSLGRYAVAGNSGSHEMRLFRAANYEVIASVNVNMTGAAAGKFQYADLAAPIVLAPATTYILASREYSGGDYWYNCNTEVTSSSDGTVSEGAYSPTGTNFYFYCGAGHSYVPVDLRYQKPPLIPHTLSVLSTEPDTGVDVTLSPIDLNSEGSGVTPLARSYNEGTDITVTVPATVGNSDFVQWLVDGNPATNATSVTISIASDVQLTAVYTNSILTQYAYVQDVTAGTARNNHSGSLGLRFRVGASPIAATALGRWRLAGNSQSHTVKLVRASDSTEIASVSIDASAGTADQFQFAGLSAPVLLAANTEYYLVSREYSAGDQWLDCDTTITTSTAAQALSAVFSTGDETTYSTSCDAGDSFGPVNLKYRRLSEVQIIAANPEGSVNIDVTPEDFEAQAGGATPLVRTYYTGTPLTLTAPATAGTNTFIKWQTNGVDFSESPVITWSAEDAAVLTAVYDVSGTTNMPLVFAHQLGSLRSDFSGMVGARIRVGARALTVTALGRMMNAGNSGTHTMKIVRASDSSTVSGSTVQVDMSTGIEGQFSYQSLVAPIQLEAGAAYYVVSQESAGGDAWRDINSTVVPTSAAEVLGGAYSVGTGAQYFSYGAQGHVYGPVDLKYAPMPEVQLTVSSSNAVPSSIWISLSDNSGLSSGTPSFTRTFYQGTTVTLTTPLSVDGKPFSAWLLDGASAGYDSTISVTMGAAHELIAVYDTTPGAEAQLVTGQVLSTLRNDFNGWVGTRFSVGTNAMRVTSLGRMIAPGNTGAHTVKLVQGSDGQDVPGASVSLATSGGTPGQYAFGALTTPVNLTAGAVYYLVSQEFNGGDQFYDVATTVSTTTAAAVQSGVFGFGAGAWYSYGAAGHTYGPLNLIYETGITNDLKFITGRVLGTSRSDFNGWIGMRFTVGSRPLSVTSLGRMVSSGNTGTHSLKIVLASTGQDVAGTTVSVDTTAGTSGKFLYGALTSPVTLASGATYYLVSQETSGGDSWYDVNTTITTSADGTGGPGVFGFGPGAWYTYGATNHSYGPVDFTYKRL